MRVTDYHATALAFHRSRRSDWLAIVVMLAAFFAGLAVVECIAITVLDWLDGRPHTVIPAILAFLETLDGARP